MAGYRVQVVARRSPTRSPTDPAPGSGDGSSTSRTAAPSVAWRCDSAVGRRRGGSAGVWDKSLNNTFILAQRQRDLRAFEHCRMSHTCSRVRGANHIDPRTLRLRPCERKGQEGHDVRPPGRPRRIRKRHGMAFWCSIHRLRVRRRSKICGGCPSPVARSVVQMQRCRPPKREIQARFFFVSS